MRRTAEKIAHLRKTALERVSSSLPQERFDGWKEGFERGK